MPCLQHETQLLEVYVCLATINAVNPDAERCCWCARAVVTWRANKLRILPLIDVHRNVSARSTALELTPAIIAIEHTLVVGPQTLHYKKITQSDVLHSGPRAERSSSLSDTRRAQSRWNV